MEVSLLVNRLMASRTGAIGVDIDGHQQSIDSVSDHHLTGATVGWASVRECHLNGMTPVVDVERLCLVAIHDPVDVDEIRRHWNMKETPILDGLVTTAPSLPLGPVDVPVPVEGNKGGPSGRVFSLLWLRGTIPEYVLPKLDDTLARELLECFEPMAEDPPAEYVSRDEVASFLKRHSGAGVITTSRIA